MLYISDNPFHSLIQQVLKFWKTTVPPREKNTSSMCSNYCQVCWLALLSQQDMLSSHSSEFILFAKLDWKWVQVAINKVHNVTSWPLRWTLKYAFQWPEGKLKKTKHCTMNGRSECSPAYKSTFLVLFSETVQMLSYKYSSNIHKSSWEWISIFKPILNIPYLP